MTEGVASGEWLGAYLWGDAMPLARNKSQRQPRCLLNSLTHGFSLRKGENF